MNLKTCRAVKRNQALLGQELPSERPTGAHTDASEQKGRKKVPEGGVDSAVGQLSAFCILAWPSRPRQLLD